MRHAGSVQGDILRKMLQRPAGVKVISVLHLCVAGAYFFAALKLILAYYHLWDDNRQQAAKDGIDAMREFLAGDLIQGYGEIALLLFVLLATLFVACLFFFLGIFLWKMANLARQLDIVVLSLVLLFGVPRVLFALRRSHAGVSNTLWIGLAIDLWVLLYLFRPRVKQAFRSPAPRILPTTPQR